MAQENLVQESVDRINGEFERVQKRIRAQRRSFEKQIADSRKSFEKRTRKQAKRFRSELRKSPTVKRAQRLQRQASRRVEDAVDRVLGIFQIASKSDVDRIDRKLNQISRKLKEIEKARRTNGASSHTAAGL